MNPIQNAVSNYQLNQPSALKQTGRKVLNFLSGGRIAVNPKLNRIIKEVLRTISDEAVDVEALKDLSLHAHSDHAKSALREQLDHTIGAIRTSTVSADQVKAKAEEKGFLTVNDPFNAVSFALGTFSQFPLNYNGVKYTCLEAAFQAQKFEDPEIQKRFEGLTGIQAQRLADSLKKEMRKDWADKCVGVMERLIEVRSIQNPEYVDLLKSSADSYLVVHSPNSAWGDGGNAKGENILGKLLMSERGRQEGLDNVAPPLSYFESYEIPQQPAEYQVCSYNMGASVNDYMNQHGKVKEGHNDLNQIWQDGDLYGDAAEMLGDVRKKLQEDVADFLFHPSKGDVFCLQEVTESNKDLLEVLKDRGFEINYAKGHRVPDTVIAVNKRKFKDIENQSFIVEGADVALATAINRETGQKTTFVSGHIAGYNLEAQDGSEFYGDKDVDNIVKKIKQICEESDVVIFGADFNTSPELHPGRFGPLADEGFGIYTTGEATNITTNPKFATNLIERPLDHFAVRNSLEDHEFEIITPKGGIGLDPYNPSDHMPIFLRVTHVVEEKGLWF